jgi:hypothetical protein
MRFIANASLDKRIIGFKKVVAINISVFYVKNWYSGGGVQLDPLGTTATNRPIVSAAIMMMEKLVEWWLVRETELLGETCPSAALSTTKPTCCPDAKPDRRGRKPATNRLSYGTAYILCNHRLLFVTWQWTPHFIILSECNHQIH